MKKTIPGGCCHDNRLFTSPVLIKAEIPSFFLNQGPFTPGNLRMRVNTIYGDTMSVQSGRSVPLKGVENEYIWLLTD